MKLWIGMVFACAALAQDPDGFLDLFIVKIKPEKRAEFSAIVKKMADANRQHRGDYWLTSEVMYGESGTFYFGSLRNNHADVETAFGKFMGALTKAYGAAAAGKLMQDFEACISSSRAELRRRRTELSANPPRDAAALAKIIGNGRFVRTTAVRVRPGRGLDLENQLRSTKAAIERQFPLVTVLVSQSDAGANGVYYYLSSIQSSMGGFDALPSSRQLFGAQLETHQRAVAEVALSTQTVIGRYVPELSNPTEAYASVAPDFWRPRPPAASKPKPKAAAPKTQ